MRKTTLIIDDSSRKMATVLKALGKQPLLTCSTPEEARQILQEQGQNILLAVIDNHMMQKDGTFDFFATELATLAKDQGIPHRIIYTAGHTEEAWKGLAAVRVAKNPHSDHEYFVDKFMEIFPQI